MTDPEQAVRPRVVLIGPMGAGKSTVARFLGKRWGLAVRDTDHDVETRAGRSIQDIFVDDGETAFRAMEAEAVAAALTEHEGVLALGGGAVLAEPTRELLADHTVVYLKVGLSDAVRRVGIGESRPLLNQAVGGGMRARIKQLLDERGPIYESVATHAIDTDGRPAAAVAEEIAELVEASPR